MHIKALKDGDFSPPYYVKDEYPYLKVNESSKDEYKTPLLSVK